VRRGGVSHDTLTVDRHPGYGRSEVGAYLLLLLMPQLGADQPCAEAMNRQLRAWHATNEVLRAPGGPLGGAVYRIATDELGVWITVHRPRGLATVSLFRTDSRGTVRLDVDERCEPEPAASLPAPLLPEGAFTDADLKEQLASNDRLIVYLWSPHLPLSVEGYHEIVAASGAIGVPLVAVVDGTADEDFVEQEADDNGIPAEARRPMGSIELLFRDLAVHTPSILVFSSGTVASPLPGYRTRKGYRAYLDAIFGGARGMN
jgi:hypothetical protein